MCKCCAKQKENKIILGVALFSCYGKMKGMRGHNHNREHTMSIAIHRDAKLRRKVSGFSSGSSYSTPQQWHNLVSRTCYDAGLELGELPEIHCGLDEGIGGFYLPLTLEGKYVGEVYVFIYRYRSGRWEIVAYIV